MGLTVLSSGAAPQTLQALPSHGESLFFLAHELGVRVLKRKRLRNQVEELEQRYFEYLHLLASDTQVRPGSLNRGSPGEELWGAQAGCPRPQAEVPSPSPSVPGVARLAPRLLLSFLT